MDDVIASARTALGLNPKFFIAHYMAGVALLAKGQAKEALAEMQQEPEGPWHSIGLPLAWHALGNKAEADAALADLIRKFENDSAYNIAYVYAYRGESDHAFEWLDKAVANKDAGLSEIGVQPLFANIRRDPRWLPLLRKLNRAPEQLAAIPFEVKLPGSGAIGAKKPGAP